MKNLILIFILFALSSPLLAQDSFNAEEFKKELAESAEYFKYGVDGEKIPAKTAKVTKKREIKKSESENGEFADLESVYFDKISTRQSSVKKTKKVKRKRSR